MKTSTKILIILCSGIAFNISLIALARVYPNYPNKGQVLEKESVRENLTHTIRAFWPKALVCPITNGLIHVKNEGTFYKIEYSLDGGRVSWNSVRKMTESEIAQLNP